MGESEGKAPIPDRPLLLKDQLAVVVRAIANVPSSVNIEIRLSAMKLFKEYLQVQMKYGVFGKGTEGKKVFAEIVKKGMADTILERYFREQREKKT